MLERHLFVPASPQHLWETLTDPASVSTWFGAEVDWDLRPGGPARFVEHDGAVREGQIEEVVDHQQLRFRWWPEDHADHESSEVTYLLAPEGEGTDLTITERQLPMAQPAGPTTAQALTATAGWTTWDGRLVGVWSRAMAPVAIGTR
jgi:uncharacterized protein YndB with AHSA1/START domain